MRERANVALSIVLRVAAGIITHCGKRRRWRYCGVTRVRKIEMPLPYPYPGARGILLTTSPLQMRLMSRTIQNYIAS